MEQLGLRDHRWQTSCHIHLDTLQVFTPLHRRDVSSPDTSTLPHPDKPKKWLTNRQQKNCLPGLIPVVRWMTVYGKTRIYSVSLRFSFRPPSFPEFDKKNSDIWNDRPTFFILISFHPKREKTITTQFYDAYLNPLCFKWRLVSDLTLLQIFHRVINFAEKRNRALNNQIWTSCWVQAKNTTSHIKYFYNHRCVPLQPLYNIKLFGQPQ